MQRAAVDYFTNLPFLQNIRYWNRNCLGLCANHFQLIFLRPHLLHKLILLNDIQRWLYSYFNLGQFCSLLWVQNSNQILISESACDGFLLQSRLPSASFLLAISLLFFTNISCRPKLFSKYCIWIKHSVDYLSVISIRFSWKSGLSIKWVSFLRIWKCQVDLQLWWTYNTKLSSYF